MPGNIISITPAQIASWPTPVRVAAPHEVSNVLLTGGDIERTWMPAYAGTLFACSTIMVFLRLWLRASRQAGDLGFDDAFILVAWLAITTFTTTSFMFSLQAHLGRHTWDLPLANFETIAKLSFTAELSFLLCQGCTKISVLLFYRRLVKDTYAKVWKSAVIGAIVFTALWTLAFVFLLIFNCSPTEAYWRSFEPTYTHPYKCVDTTIVNLLAGIFAIISDFYAVVLPCMMTRRFDLPTAQKLALNGLFSVGLVVVAAGAVRTYYLYRKALPKPATRERS
ncbi:hypothetical protein LTR86_006597 [Recurvomyces mirabilis]|nr:hypothetical protein LTR86_006597 [Recurvomyces mirabilis]